MNVENQASRFNPNDIASQPKPKSPGRVQAMQNRWHSDNPRWVAWRQSRIAAMTGAKKSPKTREAISLARTGQHWSEEAQQRVLERSGIRPRVYPLLLRDARADNIIWLTGVTREQIKTQRGLLRKEGKLAPSTKEYLHAMVATPRSPKKREYTQEQEKHAEFAKRLLQAGFFTEDIRYWNLLQRIYKTLNRAMPTFFPDRLLLEGFLRAKIVAETGDTRLLKQFRHISDGVDQRLFHTLLVEEEILLTKMVQAGKKPR